MNKKEAFFKSRAESRRLPGHCNRCGKPHDGPFKQCDECRGKRAVRVKKTLSLIECIAMAQQCRREVTKLRGIVKRMKQARINHYSLGYKAGKKQGLTLSKYHGAYPQISAQELSQINHAYQGEAERK